VHVIGNDVPFGQLLTVTFDNCKFIKNSKRAVLVDRTVSYLFAGDLEVGFTNSLFEYNSDGAVWVNSTIHDEISIPSSVYFYNCSFISNMADSGAALELSGVVQAVVSNSTFQGNQAVLSHGGAIAFYGPGPLSFISEPYTSLIVTDCTFSNNVALVGNGGALYISNGNAKEINITDSRFLYNIADGEVGSGGAIAVENLCFQGIGITNCSFGSNKASYLGGALSLYGVAIWLIDSHFENNHAIFGGAASLLGLLDSESFVIAWSTFEANRATYGGSLYAIEGIALIEDCSFKQSYASLAGGAIFVGQTGSYITHTSFEHCVAGQSHNQNQCVESCSGGALYVDGAVTCIDCWFSNNCGYFFPNGLAVAVSGNFLCMDCHFANHTSCAPNTQSGTIAAWNGVVSIVSSKFTNNAGSIFTNSTQDSSSLRVNFTSCSFVTGSDTPDALTIQYGAVDFVSCDFSSAVINYYQIGAEGFTSFINSSISSLSALIVSGSLKMINSDLITSSSSEAIAIHIIHGPYAERASASLNVIDSQLAQVNIKFYLTETSAIVGSSLWDCVVTVESSYGVIFSDTSFNHSSLNITESAVVVRDSTITTLDSFDVSNSVVAIQGSYIESTALTLTKSNATIDNTTFAGIPADTNDVVCFGGLSNLMGDFIGWTYSNSCNTVFHPIVINESITNAVFLSTGSSDYVEIVLPTSSAGMNITVSLQQSYVAEESSPTVSLNIYLVPAPCGYSMDISSYSYLTDSGQQMAQVSFDGPTFEFMRPNTTAPSHYCLITNASVPIPAYVASVQFIERNLTTTSTQFIPARSVYWYSTSLTVQYSLLDQWGDLFTISDSLEFYSTDCVNFTCGSTYPELPNAEKLLNFDISPDWKLWTKVNVSLPYQPTATVAYGRT